MNPFHLFLLIATLFVMEFAVALVHKHVMHGFGWGWHRSHHEAPKGAGWEKNDLYAIVFAAATILLFMVGASRPWLWWIALGITIYGMLYGILHDVIIHRRLPLAWRPRSGYLQRLATAHHLHHAVRTRENGVSFGFLYAPPVDAIRRQLRGGDRQP
ncbi:sterol desaturase family protein [Noviherbaspirillum sp. L7-7A]|uniref:sterol desaturase family protein n=1 Tax=Noviherbaspirillum sp. L7-7A TaxID=2850560 RepID=UPI001C2CA133|nr:sterol desaturase family protein [Noviherbaspirillum sp. L7-7A]MBV0881701.1 sterol desaturase family protein [Noviherbaspirillum sp. L7-7A]